MRTFLLTWNSTRWDWTDIDECIQTLKADGLYKGGWSTGTNKSIEVGDRLFLIHLGIEPRGICASGYARSECYQDAHWNGEEGKLTNYIEIDFDVIINPFKDSIIGMDILKTGVLSEQFWSTQNSGISIRPNVAEELETLWFNFLNDKDIFPDSFVQSQDMIDKSDISLTEGALVQVTSNKYERNPHARKICINHFGAKCSVCGFDFSETYGSIGKDYIHVHHLNPISEIGKEYKLNPTKDLRPVCPNCHAMIHKTKPAMELDELKRLIKK
jgi:5-methylcytosine-specific restriction enzyme A